MEMEVEMEMEAEAEVEMEAEVEAETQAEVEVQTEVQTEAEAEVQTEVEVQAEVQTEAETEAEAEAEVQVQVPVPVPVPSLLPKVPLLHIFSFLDASSLLQAGQVSKYWNKMADDENLWRSLCRSRWSGSWEAPQVPAWKQLFLAQARRELRMARAQPQDFSYREAPGSLGVLGPLAYFSGSDPSMSGQKSIVCAVSSRRVLYAWDVQEGSLTWSSPAQQANIKHLATLPQRSLAFTVDREETVKVWNCQDAEPLATRSMPRCCFSLEAFLADDGPVLMVGDSEGDIHTLTVPTLASVSRVNAFGYSVDLLYCSPNRKWVFASGIHPHMLPQVFSAQGLLRPGGSAPSSVSLPFAFCSQACWALKCANRVTVMFRRASCGRTGFGTFDLAATSPGGRSGLEARQIAAFMLPDGMEDPLRMGVRDGDSIVFESGPHLFLFSIRGHLLHRFSHHQKAICSLWVDSLHVLTASTDNYLHLYMWEEEGRGAGLLSCCHLEQRRADPTPSCYYSRAICDSASIVCVVSKAREASVLVMYSLDP